MTGQHLQQACILRRLSIFRREKFQVSELQLTPKLSIVLMMIKLMRLLSELWLFMFTDLPTAVLFAWSEQPTIHYVAPNLLNVGLV